MSVARAKKPKKPAALRVPRDKKTVMDIVKSTNYVTMAALILDLWDVYGWRKKRIEDFYESYLALLGETVDHRMSALGLLAYCYEKTGIDVKELVDEMYKKVG